MKVVAFLPAKGSSGRIVSKNQKLLDGKPLFLHTLEKLCEADFIDEVYLDTESDEIIDLASEINCKILKRDSSLATNATDGNQLFMNEVKQVDADVYIQILCTSPFINLKTIRESVKIVSSSENYDSGVLVKKERHYSWDKDGPQYNVSKIPNSVDLPETIIETMGLYVIKKDAALKYRRRIGNSPLKIFASPLEAIDVNWPEEFELANLIAAGMRERDRKLLDNIKNQITSSMLSDILDDQGFSNQVVKGLKPNLRGSKILGRAKTLKLRELREGEDFRGIYTALSSYDTIVPNDIIVVENEVGNYAYFGELNANLAIRAGASGVIVNGMTRDKEEVAATGLPVFSAGYTCQDVRKRATTAFYNKEICLNGISVAPECLVFADTEGVIIIPREVECNVIEEVYRRAANEKSILAEIANGVDVGVLTESYGFF